MSDTCHRCGSSATWEGQCFSCTPDLKTNAEVASLRAQLQSANERIEALTVERDCERDFANSLQVDLKAANERAERAERELEEYRMRLAGAFCAATGYHSREQRADIPAGLPWKNCPTIDAVIALYERKTVAEAKCAALVTEVVAMRAALTELRDEFTNETQTDYRGTRRWEGLDRADAALATDAGKGWVSPEEHARVQAGAAAMRAALVAADKAMPSARHALASLRSFPGDVTALHEAEQLVMGALVTDAGREYLEAVEWGREAHERLSKYGGVHWAFLNRAPALVRGGK